MCLDPGTLAVMALATTAAGTAYQGYAQQQQAKYQEGVANTNAVYADRQAADAQRRGEQELQAHYRQVSQLKGAQRASLAATGVDLGFGSASDVQKDTAFLANEDANRINANTANEVQGFLIGGQNYRAEAQAQRLAATQAKVGTTLGLGATLIGGATSVGTAFGKYGAPKWSGAWGRRIATAYGYKG